MTCFDIYTHAPKMSTIFIAGISDNSIKNFMQNCDVLLGNLFVDQLIYQDKLKDCYRHLSESAFVARMCLNNTGSALCTN